MEEHVLWEQAVLWLKPDKGVGCVYPKSLFRTNLCLLG